MAGGLFLISLLHLCCFNMILRAAPLHGMLGLGSQDPSPIYILIQDLISCFVYRLRLQKGGCRDSTNGTRRPASQSRSWGLGSARSDGEIRRILVLFRRPNVHDHLEVRQILFSAVNSLFPKKLRVLCVPEFFQRQNKTLRPSIIIVTFFASGGPIVMLSLSAWRNQQMRAFRDSGMRSTMRHISCSVASTSHERHTENALQ